MTALDISAGHIAVVVVILLIGFAAGFIAGASSVREGDDA